MMDDDGGVANGLAREDLDNDTHFSIVLHVDLDCFYAAVEHVRLGIPREKPLAVQQWRGLIAINYAARAAGITRHERAEQALKKCPELQLVHVETIGEVGGNVDAPDRGQAKVSLERYRQASAKVFAIFRRFSNVYEKASIDEAYLDITSKVEDMISQGCDWDSELTRLLGNNEQGVPTMVVLDGPLMPFNSYDRRMLAGAVVADQIRESVRNELGYTCSVGIATNKLLAKIASAKNKPDRQTLIPPRAVQGLMQTMPLKKMRLLGGKLGEELTQKWGFSTAGEAQALPLPTLVSSFGERQGIYVWNAVRGIQADKVQAKQIPKSMLAAKSFSPIKELSDVRRWLGILSDELSVRMLRDFEQNNRHPRLLQLYYRSGGFKHAKDHSKSWTMPHAALSLLSSPSLPSQQQASEAGREAHDKDHDKEQYVVHLAADDDHGASEFEERQDLQSDAATVADDLGEEPSEGLGLVLTERSAALARVLQDAAYNKFKSLEGTFPCSRLALAASSFQDVGAPGTKSIQHFFSNAGRGGAAAAAASASTGERISSPKKNLLGESSLEKLKGKQKGILKSLGHPGSKPVDDVAGQSKNSHRDVPDTLLHAHDGNEVSKAEDLQHGSSVLQQAPATNKRREKEGVADPIVSRNEDQASGFHNKAVGEPLDSRSESGRFQENESIDHETTKVSGDLSGGTLQICDHRSSDDGSLGRSRSDEFRLQNVNMKEQSRILADIQYLNSQSSKPEQEKRTGSATGAAKRPRQAVGQQSIGKFFHKKDKS